MVEFKEVVKLFNKYNSFINKVLKEENRASLFTNDKYYNECCKQLHALQQEAYLILKEIEYYGCRRK